MGLCPSKYTYEKRVVWDCNFDAASVNYNLVNFRGVPQNPTFRPAELEQLVSTFETRDNDVFICTYPKCGTTWMQIICNLLATKGEQSNRTVYAFSPWLECLTAAPILHEREANNYSIQELADLPTDVPRFFKSHANFADLPRGKAAVKTIIVARNLKDTCVSMWHHAREKPEFNLKKQTPGGEDSTDEVCPNFDEFAKLFLAGKCECGSWFEHTLEWYAASLVDDDILFIKYEDLYYDPKKYIGMVAKFSNTGNDPETILKTTENSSMGKVKANSAQSGVYAGNVRSGGSGKWRKMFSEEISALFDRVYQDRMLGSGLEFDFGEGVIM